MARVSARGMRCAAVSFVLRCLPLLQILYCQEWIDNARLFSLSFCSVRVVIGGPSSRHHLQQIGYPRPPSTTPRGPTRCQNPRMIASRRTIPKLRHDGNNFLCLDFYRSQYRGCPREPRAVITVCRVRSRISTRSPQALKENTVVRPHRHDDAGTGTG